LTCSDKSSRSEDLFLIISSVSSSSFIKNILIVWKISSKYNRTWESAGRATTVVLNFVKMS
jgi:hypothetical protein